MDHRHGPGVGRTGTPDRPTWSAPTVTTVMGTVVPPTRLRRSVRSSISSARPTPVYPRRGHCGYIRLTVVSPVVGVKRRLLPLPPPTTSRLTLERYL